MTATQGISLNPQSNLPKDILYTIGKKEETSACQLGQAPHLPTAASTLTETALLLPTVILCYKGNLRTPVSLVLRQIIKNEEMSQKDN